MDAALYAQSMAFSGEVWQGSTHLVGFADARLPLILPPSGRHVHVVAVADLADARRLLAPFERFVLIVGGSNTRHAQALAPVHARISRLGAMQKPPLDGPVDRRNEVRCLGNGG